MHLKEMETPLRYRGIGIMTSLLLFVVFSVIIGGGLYTLFTGFGYTWRWQSIPRYFYYTYDDDVLSTIEGRVEALDIHGRTGIITIEGLETHEVYRVSADSIRVSKGDSVFQGDILGTVLVGKTGLFTHGLLETIKISGLAMIGALVIGVWGGFTLYAGIPPAQGLIRGLMILFYSVPLLWQILLWYFFIMPMIYYRLPPRWFGIIALSCYAGVHITKIVHHTILRLVRSRPKQNGFGMLMATILPDLSVQWSTLLKASSLLSLVSVNELTKVTRTTSFQPIEMMLTCALLYCMVIRAQK